MSKATKTYVIVGVVLAIVIVIAIKQSGSTPADMDAGTADEIVGAQAQAPDGAARAPEAGLDPAPDAEVGVADQPAPDDPPTTGERTAQLPRFVEVGADSCIPCKMMKPVLDELGSAYAGRLQVEFADVWNNPDLGDKYQVRTIPTQVIYDAEGNEVFRHIGYWPKEEIDQKLKELGILE